MKRSFIIFLHLGYWLLFVLLLGLFLSVITLQSKRAGGTLTAVWPVLVLCLVPNLIAFYSSHLYLFPVFLRVRRFVLTGLAGVLICLASALSALGLSALIFGSQQPVFADGVEFFGLFFSFFFIAAIHAGMALIIRGFLAWFDEMRLKEELAEKNYATEIALLKSQINPHFLFNTINNIDVLIGRDAAKASQYLHRLSDLLRYLVYDTKAEKIALTDEIAYLEKYLELQKIRTANPDYVGFSVTGEAENLRIAPMIFFPFIENAFKHTENNRKSNTIRIGIAIVERTIDFECENTYQHRSESREHYGGLGNELIKRRLELLYPGRHRFQISDSGGVYRVSLTIYED